MKRLPIIISLIGISTIGIGSSYIVASTDSKTTTNPQDASAIDINTIWSTPESKHMSDCNTSTQWTDKEITSFLWERVRGGDNERVINDLVVGTRTGTTDVSVLISVKPTCTQYTGTFYVTYSVVNKKSIATDLTDTLLFASRDDSTWQSTPTKLELFTQIKDLNDDVDINEIDVDMSLSYCDQTSQQFQVNITPIANSSYYSGSQTVYWYLAKRNLSDIFDASQEITIHKPWTYDNENFGQVALLPVAQLLNVIKSCTLMSGVQIDLDNDISPFTFNLNSNITATNPNPAGKFITLTIGSNNPSINAGSITFDDIEIDDAQTFNLTWAQLNGQGWSGCTQGSVTFSIYDPDNNLVTMNDALVNPSTTASDIGNVFGGTNIVMGNTVQNEGNTYTITGITIGSTSNLTISSSNNTVRFSGFGAYIPYPWMQQLDKIVGTVTLPTTLTSLACNQAFSNQSRLTKIIFPEGMQDIPNAAFFDTYYITQLEIPASVKNFVYGCLGLACSPVWTSNDASAVAWRQEKLASISRDFIFKSNYFVSCNATITGSGVQTHTWAQSSQANQYSIANPICKDNCYIYVQPHLVAQYKNDSNYIAWIGQEWLNTHILPIDSV